MNVDVRLLQRIYPKNVLSFGPDFASLPLENLNVFIGPNGSGKSNLIDVLALMRATSQSPSPSQDLRGVIRRGGGANEWVWKGNKLEPADIKLLFTNPVGEHPLRHRLSFRNDGLGFKLDSESIHHFEFGKGIPGDAEEDYFYHKYEDGRSIINIAGEEERQIVNLRKERELSILAAYRDPIRYPELTYLSESYEKIRIYRDWAFGRNTVFREPQKADMRNDFLEEDFSNLGLILSRLRREPRNKSAIVEGLKDLYEGLTDFETIVEGGTVQVFFTEGDFSIPATRLSDGTLRYLCLLAILCDPKPPPLICIEEPELGLHPDILPKLADHLVQASTRTQLIVTTHSDILIDAMTERPEVVVVCEKHEGKTEMRRLKSEELKGWLEKYRLGQLWSKGQIGGNRW